MAKQEMVVGESVELEGHFGTAGIPAGTTWNSSNPSVISIEETNESGVVKVVAVGEGEATVHMNLGGEHESSLDFKVAPDTKTKATIKVRK